MVCDDDAIHVADSSLETAGRLGTTEARLESVGVPVFQESRFDEISILSVETFEPSSLISNLISHVLLFLHR
jgi:hypothetical protein